MTDNKIINFMGWRKVATSISLILVLASIAALAVNGLKLGLDFTGGSQVEVSFSAPANLPKIRSTLEELGLTNPVAVLFGSETDVLIRSQGAMQDGAVNTIAKNLAAINASATIDAIERAPRDQSNYAQQLLISGATQAEIENANIFNAQYYGAVTYALDDNGIVVLLENSMDTAYTAELLNVLGESTNSEVELRRSEFVGPQIGAELRDEGGLGMLLALAVVMLYVAARFQLKFSVGAVVALIHDVIIVLGFFAILQLDFDLTVLAALLAVIGYSLNDTIVVFDRIRENFRKIRKATPIEVVNVSLTETLERTLITSLTTLLVLVILYFFGGELISGFAIALIVGVVVGTYSSVYVSANTLLQMDVNKEDLMPTIKEGAELDEMP